MSIVASIIGTLFVRMGKNDVPSPGKIMGAMYKGLIIASVLSAIAFYFVAQAQFGDGGVALPNGQLVGTIGIFVCALVGLIVTGLITFITEYLHRHAVQPGQADRESVARRATRPT